MPGLRVAATVPMCVSSGPTLPTAPGISAMVWQPAHPLAVKSCLPWSMLPLPPVEVVAGWPLAGCTACAGAGALPGFWAVCACGLATALATGLAAAPGEAAGGTVGAGDRGGVAGSSTAGTSARATMTITTGASRITTSLNRITASLLRGQPTMTGPSPGVKLVCGERGGRVDRLRWPLRRSFTEIAPAQS